MPQRKYIIEVIDHIVKNRATAEMIVDRLEEEGVLHLGYGNADVDNILAAFSKTFGTTKASKYDRWAATRLTAKYGSQSICGVIQLLGKADDKYKPVVNSVAQLEEKIPSILNYLRNLKGNEELDV